MSGAENGLWLPGACRRPSPNHNQRPTGMAVDLLVIHNISLPPGEFGGPWVDDLFLNRLDLAVHPWFAQLAGLRVSAHLLIRRDGEAVQYVALDRRAWHAGLSAWEGREGCNDFSIGIELEGTDELPFTEAQYERLIELTRAIQALYPLITPLRIRGHSEIAPGRKTDPGPAFDWARYRAALCAEGRKEAGQDGNERSGRS